MALLNGIRCTLLIATSSQITVGPNILGFQGMNVAAGAINGNTYQWVLEANFNSLGVATAREGGTGVWNSAFGTLQRNTIWSTNNNAQIPITGTTHVIVTPMAEQDAANLRVIPSGTTYIVTTEKAILIASGGGATIQLPSFTVRQGGWLSVKDMSNGATFANSTINPAGGEFIDGAAAATINAPFGGFLLAPTQETPGLPTPPGFAFGWYIVSNVI